MTTSKARAKRRTPKREPLPENDRSEITADGGILLQHGLMPLTVNALLSQAPGHTNYKAHSETARWRRWARDNAPTVLSRDGVPGKIYVIPGCVAVTVWHLRPHAGAAPDVGAPYLAVKAAIDGLVEAGTLPVGDGPYAVKRLTMEAPVIAGYHGLRIALTPLPDAVPAMEDERQPPLWEGTTNA